MVPSLDFWFDFASTYSYVAALRVEEECARKGVAVAWRPFLLGPLFVEQSGIKDSPFNANPVRGRYMWRDLERLCAKHGLPWRKPGAFPRNSVLAARAALAAGASGAAHGPAVSAGAGRTTAGFARAVFRANFAEDRDIADPAVIAALGGDLQRAQQQEIKDALRRNVDEARALGFFGAPMFVTGGEPFFGQDRLADAIEWARKT